jgi:hypothetical protein
VIPVRYGLNSYINLLRNLVFKGLRLCFVDITIRRTRNRREPNVHLSAAVGGPREEDTEPVDIRTASVWALLAISLGSEWLSEGPYRGRTLCAWWEWRLSIATRYTVWVGRTSPSWSRWQAFLHFSLFLTLPSSLRSIFLLLFLSFLCPSLMFSIVSLLSFLQFSSLHLPVHIYIFFPPFLYLLQLLEFLPTDPEIPGSMPGTTKFSQK